MRKQTLFQWISDGDTAACRLGEKGDGDPVVVVRSGVGAEHFFAIVDTDQCRITYLPVSVLLDSYGTDQTVWPLVGSGIFR